MLPLFVDYFSMVPSQTCTHVLENEKLLIFFFSGDHNSYMNCRRDQTNQKKEKITVVLNLKAERAAAV